MSKTYKELTRDVVWRTQTEVRQLIEFTRANRVEGPMVEIGSFLGCSTRAFASSGVSPILAVDTWENGYDPNDGASEEFDMDDVYAEFLRRCHCEISTGCIIPMKANSYVMSKLLTPCSLSMAYIDGKHTYDTVLSDLMNMYPLVRNGGLIAGHDWNIPEVMEAIQSFIHSDRVYPSTTVDTLKFYEGHNWAFKKG